MANTPQNYLNVVATEESRKHKLFELENRLHKQELYSANTVQKDLNRLIDGWNAMEGRLDALNKRIDQIERKEGRGNYSRSRSNKISGGRRTRGKKRTKSRRKSRRKKKTKKRRKSMRKKRR